MLKSDYKWNDEELKQFYHQVATKKPSEQNRSRGGVYFRKNITPLEIFKGEDGLNVLYYYQVRFEENNFFSHARVIRNVISGCKLEILRTREKLFIPSYEAGEMLAGGVVERNFRTILNAFESVLIGKPNKTARFFFAGV